MSVDEHKISEKTTIPEIEPKRVVLIDDDINFHGVVISELANSTDFQLVACFFTIEAFLSSDEVDADIILLDYYLESNGGVENIFKLKKNVKVNTEIIMITVEGKAEHILHCLRAGATGYFIKNEFFESLNADLSMLIRGGAAMSPFVARLLIDSLSPKSNIRNLNPKEEAILKGLSNGKTYQEVADDLKIDLNTVRYYVKKIYKKLHVNNKVDAVKKWMNS